MWMPPRLFRCTLRAEGRPQGALLRRRARRLHPREPLRRVLVPGRIGGLATIRATHARRPRARTLEHLHPDSRRPRPATSTRSKPASCRRRRGPGRTPRAPSSHATSPEPPALWARPRSPPPHDPVAAALTRAFSSPVVLVLIAITDAAHASGRPLSLCTVRSALWSSAHHLASSPVPRSLEPGPLPALSLLRFLGGSPFPCAAAGRRPGSREPSPGRAAPAALSGTRTVILPSPPPVPRVLSLRPDGRAGPGLSLQGRVAPFPSPAGSVPLPWHPGAARALFSPTPQPAGGQNEQHPAHRKHRPASRLSRAPRHRRQARNRAEARGQRHGRAIATPSATSTWCPTP